MQYLRIQTKELIVITQKAYIGYEYEIDALNQSYTPDDNVPIFRYMDFSKYLDLIEERKLCFCNAKNFKDKFEGEMPEAFYHNWSGKYKNGYSSLATEVSKHYSAYISCWNRGNSANDENYALWKIYTHPETGVCIKSSVGSLKRALNNSNIKIFTVKYIPSFNDSSFDIELPIYTMQRKADNADTPLTCNVKEVCKLEPYNYEDEIRAIYIDASNDKIKYFNIDIVDLIDEVYFSPFSETWFHNLVRKTTYRDNGLKNKIHFKESTIKV